MADLARGAAKREEKDRKWNELIEKRDRALAEATPMTMDEQHEAMSAKERKAADKHKGFAEMVAKKAAERKTIEARASKNSSLFAAIRNGKKLKRSKPKAKKSQNGKKLKKPKAKKSQNKKKYRSKRSSSLLG